MDIIIPYPEGVDINSNDFIIGHLIAHNYNNAKVGTMEYFTPEKTSEGLKIHITSTSPFVIGWKTAATTDNGAGSVTDNNTANAATEASTAAKTENAGVNNPSTKDNMAVRMIFVMCLMMTSAAGIVYAAKKRRA